MIYLNPAKPCFVAHFDLLGIKNAIRRDSNVVWGALCQLFEVREGSLAHSIRIPSKGLHIEDRVKHFAFSDTVVLYTRSDEDADLYSIALLATMMFENGLREGLPMRGGIAHGGFSVDERMRLFTGAALLNAYELGECAQWLGICVDQVTAERARSLGIQSNGRWPIMIRWPVPQKDGKPAERFVVDWPVFFHAKLGPAPVESGDSVFSRFAYLFDAWDGLAPEVRAKYGNTAQFINSRMSAFHSGGPE